MKRHVFFVLFFFFVRIEPKAQQSVIDNNTSLLSNLELKYKTPCIKFEASRFKVRRVKIDKIFINELNEIYYCDMKLKDMISFLEVKGYSVARKINESLSDDDR